MADDVALVLGNVLMFAAIFGGFLLIWWGSMMDDQLSRREKERDRYIRELRERYRKAGLSSASESPAPTITTTFGMIAAGDRSAASASLSESGVTSSNQ